jgi:hypothetical protein
MKRRRSMIAAGSALIGALVVAVIASVAIGSTATNSGARQSDALHLTRHRLTDFRARGGPVTSNGVGGLRTSHRVPRALLARFSALRSVKAADATSTDGLPAGLAATYPERHPGLGLDMNSVSSVNVSSNVTVWIVPGSVGTCLIGTTGDGGWTSACERNATVESSGIVYTRGGPVGAGGASPETVVGILPNGITSITATPAAGTPVTAAVSNNAFTLDGGASGFTSLSYRDPSTASMVTVPLVSP